MVPLAGHPEGAPPKGLVDISSFDSFVFFEMSALCFRNVAFAILSKLTSDQNSPVFW